MHNLSFKTMGAATLAALLVALPARLTAQDTAKPAEPAAAGQPAQPPAVATPVPGTAALPEAAAEPAPKAAKPRPKPAGIPFGGKISALDNTAMTITIQGKEKSRTFHVTSRTRIHKEGKPAVFADAAVGEEIGGTFKSVNGKLELQTLRLGPKAVKPVKDGSAPKAKKAAKKAAKAEAAETK